MFRSWEDRRSGVRGAKRNAKGRKQETVGVGYSFSF